MVSPKKPLEQAHARFFNAFKEAQGDESKIKIVTERFRFLSSQKWDCKDRGSSQILTRGRRSRE